MPAIWFVIQSTQIRVNNEGKQVTLKVDPTNVDATITQLQEKTGWICPPQRRKELITQCREGSVETNSAVAWLQDIDVPEWYKTASKEEVQLALETGVKYIESQQKMMERDVLEETIKKMETQLKEHHDDITRQLETRIRYLEGQVVNKEEQIKSTFENAKNLVGNIRVEQLEKQLKDERDRYEAVLQHKSKVGNNVKLSGVIGERIVYSWLRDAFAGVDIQDVSGKSQRMDFCFEWKGVKVGVDAKNHSTKVDDDSMQKFIRDMKYNPQYDVGILVATTGIIPKTNGWVDVKVLEDGRQVVYMSCVAENPVERLQLVLGSVIESSKAIQTRLKETADKYGDDKAEEWIQQARDEMKRAWEQAHTLQSAWIRTHRQVEKSMKEFNNDITQVLVEMNKRVEKLEISTQQEVRYAQPPPQRKKPGPKPKQ